MSLWDGAPKNSRAVFLHLQSLATRMRVESYGEIAAAIGKREGREIAPISLNHPLGFIRDEICRQRGLPWLNALAVNGGTWLPGDSFIPHGLVDGGDERTFWRAQVLAV
jgi:hypothetical protein